MNKTRRILCIGIVFIMLAGISSFADNIGYIDMQKIFLGFDEAKKAQEDFKKKQDEYQKIFEDKQKEIEKAKTEKKTDEEIQKLISKFEKELEPQKDTLLKLNQELTLKLKDKILTASKKAAEEYGIDIVLDKQVIITGGFDLTEFVLKKLNK